MAGLIIDLSALFSQASYSRSFYKIKLVISYLLSCAQTNVRVVSASDFRSQVPGVESRWRIPLLIVRHFLAQTLSLSPFHHLDRTTLCMLGNFRAFCRLRIFFFFKQIFQEYHQSVKKFGPRFGPTICRAWSGSKLFAKVISRRQKSPLARKESSNVVQGR